MQHRRTGFSLLELIVVIGITMILIALLAPALSKTRTCAMLVQDQANLHHLLGLCSVYKADYRGKLPKGARKLSPSYPQYDDDIRWVCTETFEWYLASTRSKAEADEWLSMPFPGDKLLADTQRLSLTCPSEFADRKALDHDVGRLKERFGPGFSASMLGYNYWANRNNLMTTELFDSNGKSTGRKYPLLQDPVKMTAEQVIFSCPNYIGPTWGIELPHTGTGSGFIFTNYADPSITSPTASVYNEMKGMFFGYGDGHVAWVDRRSLWSVKQNGFAWIYVDNPRR